MSVCWVSAGDNMGVTVILVTMMISVVYQVNGNKMNIVNVSSNTIVRQGESVNMSCTTDQVNVTIYLLKHYHANSEHNDLLRIYGMKRNTAFSSSQ